MRCILLALLTSLGLTASLQVVAGPVSTQTGNLVCGPELIGLSKELGRNLCVQRSIVANLSVTGPALDAAARALVEHPIGYNPSRDPDAITCRQTEHPAGSRLPPYLSCGYNSYWKERAAWQAATAAGLGEGANCGGCDAPP